MFKHHIVLAVALLAASACHATDNKSDDMTASDFSSQKAAFVQQLDDGKTYVEITPENRKQVVSLLDRMDATLQHAGSVKQLTDEDRVAFFNEQEQVNTILTKAADDSRVTCSRETPTGSHKFITKCRTMAERRRDRNAAENLLQGAQGGAGLQGGGG